jgi:hypothetical protein
MTPLLSFTWLLIQTVTTKYIVSIDPKTKYLYFPFLESPWNYRNPKQPWVVPLYQSLPMLECHSFVLLRLETRIVPFRQRLHNAPSIDFGEEIQKGFATNRHVFPSCICDNHPRYCHLKRRRLETRPSYYYWHYCHRHRLLLLELRRAIR